MVDPQADSLLGTTLAHFKVDARLGAGGMGVVYRALDTRLNRLVALKVLPPQLAQDPERKALLLREARAAAAINHPNLAAIYEVDEQNGHAYIAMEFVQGRSLRHLLAHGPLPLELALAIAVQIAQALHRAHSAGLVHRDLKPENVMVGDDGTVKLLDFGLAKRSGLAAATGDTGARPTREGDVMGTPGYMSPEQAEGREIDHRSDLFALGAVIFEMLTGALPFKGKTVVELMVSSVRDPAPPLSQALPPEIVTLVAQLLEKMPERRPASAAQVISTLGAHAPVAPPPQSDPFAPTLASPGFASPLRARPSRALQLAIAAVAAVAVAGVAMHGLMPKKHPHLLAVADIDNRTGDRELDALSGMLITSLEQSTQLQVLTRARMVDLMRQLGKGDLERIDELAGRDVCARAGADALVISSVSRLGNSYQLDLKVAAPTEETYLLAAHEMAESKEEIPSKLDRLAQATRSRLQTDDEPKSMEISVASSQSLEAYRSYFQAEAALDRLPDTFLSADAMRAQLPLLHRATELDPGFVQAWNLVAFINLSTGEPDAAMAALQKAMNHLDRASPKDAMLTRARHAEAAHDYVTAAAKFDELFALYPDEKLALYEQGSLLFHHRRVADSIKPFERARKLDPLFGPVYDQLALAYGNLGQAPEFEAIATAYQSNVPGPVAESVRVNSLLYAGRLDEAVAMLEASKAPAAAPWTSLTLQVFHGDYAKAEQAMAALDQTKLAWVQLDMVYLRADLALARGQPARAVELLAPLADDPRVTGEHQARLAALSALAWSLTGDAGKTIDAAEKTNVSEDKTARAMALVAIAELEPEHWAEGARRVDDRDKKLVHALHQLLVTADPADASAKLDRLRELDVYLAFSARHEVEQQQLVSAISRTHECADRPVTGDFASYDFIYLADCPRCLYWRGRAFEASGKTQEAAAEYRKILSLWKDSEPLPLKADAKRRLDVLQPPTSKVTNEPH